MSEVQYKKRDPITGVTITVYKPEDNDVKFQNYQFDPLLNGGYENKAMETEHLSAGYKHSLSREAYDSIIGTVERLRAE